jgi:hypothetical protein
MKNEGRKGGKLDKQFIGPYTICEDVGKGRFRVKAGDVVLISTLRG